MNRFGISVLLVLLACTSCKQKDENNNSSASTNAIPEIKTHVHQGTEEIEKAHNKDLFQDLGFISANFALTFGGQKRMHATMITDAANSRIRLERNDGAVLVFDGLEVWVSPKDATWESARFDVFTWPYFFALPYKLNDSGTKWEQLQDSLLLGKMLNRYYLSFSEGTGDAPDDWYLLYNDPDSHLLQAAGYIVTYGGTQAEEAVKNAHAITYGDYREFEGVPIAQKWSFHNWSRPTGVVDTIGAATLTNITFLTNADSLFIKPADARIIPAP